MKKYLVVLLIIAGFASELWGQVQGETDMVSKPIDYLGFVSDDIKARPATPSCDFVSYACGYNWGYYHGYEAGLDDANTCFKYKTFYTYTGTGDVTNAFLDGHYAGWYPGYEAGYADRIAEKATSCTSPYTFDEFFCECSCDDQEYWYDGDNDNYYDPTEFTYACEPPNSKWKTLSDLFGSDCNDDDNTIWNYNECGICTAQVGITEWYYDEDQDGYHSTTIYACSNPGARYSLTTLGPDCNDRDPEENTQKPWYYFNDEDTYYGHSEESCLRPTSGLSYKWSSDPKSGEDCDDNNSNVYGPSTWYYDNDGDGYHDKSKVVVNCGKPAYDEEFSWREITKGVDCNDEDPIQYVLNDCNECTNNAEEMIFAYVDFDGDGYHSAKIELPIHDPDNNIWSSWDGEYLESPRSPCPEITLLVSEEYFDDNEFFQNEVFKSPITTIYDASWCDLSYHENEELLDQHGPTHIVSENGFYTELEYEYRSGNNNEYFTKSTRYYTFIDWEIYTQYYTLSNGVKIWRELYWDPWECSDLHHDKSVSIILSGGFKNDIYNYIKGYTYGEDCNDLDPTLKIQSTATWYYDFDQDGYYDDSRSSQFSTCDLSDFKWIRAQDAMGIDCNDRDPSKTKYEYWYFFGDDDDYYGEKLWSCGNPGKDTELEDRWYTDPRSGLDCDDTNSQILSARTWYFDNDDDNYYSETSTSCHNPGADEIAKSKWKTDPGFGIDCNDNDPTVGNDPIATYVDLDGDGYHSVYKEEDCGLNTFSESLLMTFDIYPEIEIGENDVHKTIMIPGAGRSITITKSNDGYWFPDLVVTYETLGLDCNDLDPINKGNGKWYPDTDGDGYHDASALSITGCTPPDDTYILFHNSSGADCDDTSAAFNEIKDWYQDFDGDGYFVAYQRACSSPGFGWSLTSSIGPDDDDTNPFTPTYRDEDFIIPSLLETVIIDGITYVEYLGERYELDQFSILYRGVELRFEDLLFDKVTAQDRLLANTLLSGRDAAIYDAQILTTQEGVSAARLATDPADPELQRKKTAWIDKVLKGAPEGYSASWGDVSFGTLGQENLIAERYFDGLFDLTKFQSVKHHYEDNGGAAFTMQIETEKVNLFGDNNFIKDKIGDKENADVFVYAKKFADKHIEFVYLIREDEFKANDTELEALSEYNGGAWNSEADRQEYLNQLAYIQEFRLNELPRLAKDYIPDAISPAPIISTELPPESLPIYNYGEYGFFWKCYEFLDIGHYIGHKFQMPRGTWDPQHITDDRESATRWKTKSPASLGGTIDGSLKEVRELADMVKLAKSLVYRETWTQIIESIQNFNIGEQLSGMLDTFEDKVGELRGDDIEYVQYHSIGEVTVRTLATIYAGWKIAKRFGNTLLDVDQDLSPANKLNRKHQDFNDNFENINKSENFKSLPAEYKDKLLTDISESPNGELGKVLAKNDGELVNSWEAVSKHVNIRKHVPSLEKVSDLLNDADFMGKLPNGRADLDGIIDAVKNPLDGGTASKLVKLSDHLENVKQVVKNHSGADGFDRLMVDLKNPAFAMQDGATHMLNDVKNIANGKVKKFDYEFDGDGVVCTKCRFDVELDASAGNLRLIEYKSWSLENIPNLSASQMTEYFRGIENISEMKYVFNKLKTPDLRAVKTQMKSVLSSNADDLYKVMRESMKENLDIEEFTDFTSLIDNTNSQLYDFISIN